MILENLPASALSIRQFGTRPLSETTFSSLQLCTVTQLQQTPPQDPG